MRPAYIDNTHLNQGDTIALAPRTAQFLLADGTLEELKCEIAPDDARRLDAHDFKQASEVVADFLD